MRECNSEMSPGNFLSGVLCLAISGSPRLDFSLARLSITIIAGFTAFTRIYTQSDTHTDRHTDRHTNRRTDSCVSDRTLETLLVV